MQKIVNNKIILFLMAFTLWSTAAFADDDPGGIDNDPGAAAPIDNLIPLMIVVGIAIVFYYTHKKKKAIAN